MLFLNINLYSYSYVKICMQRQFYIHIQIHM